MYRLVILPFPFPPLKEELNLDRWKLERRVDQVYAIAYEADVTKALAVIEENTGHTGTLFPYVAP